MIAILESAERPISAEDVIERAGNESLDLVTVYRNMTALREQGLIQVLQLENGKQLFEVQTSERDHHHHIVCRDCHRVVRLDLCFGSELEKYARELGYTDVTHTFEVFGLCPDCAKTTNGHRG